MRNTDIDYPASEDLAVLKLSAGCAAAEAAPPHQSFARFADFGFLQFADPKAIPAACSVSRLFPTRRFPTSFSNTADDSKPIARSILQRLSTTGF